MRETPLQASPLYRATNVYGNVLIEHPGTDNREITHYGGDSGVTARYRKGTLVLLQQHVVSYRTRSDDAVCSSTNDEHVDARNNIFYVTAAGNTFHCCLSAGGLDLTHNWFKPGHVAVFGTLSGIINDDGTSLESASPGFAGESVQDFSLSSTSIGRNAGTRSRARFQPRMMSTSSTSSIRANGAAARMR